jgi:hypothetical protein
MSSGATERHDKNEHAAMRPGSRLGCAGFAAGIVTGSEQSEIKPLLAAADEHAAKFAHIRPYWT